MVESLNSMMGKEKLTDNVLEKAFEAHWPSLEKLLKEVPQPKGPEPKKPSRTTNDLLEEILFRIRDMQFFQGVLPFPTIGKGTPQIIGTVSMSHSHSHTPERGSPPVFINTTNPVKTNDLSEESSIGNEPEKNVSTTPN